MCANRGISPALSQLEIRIKKLNMILDSIQDREDRILRHEMDIESINFDLEELRVDKDFNKVRIRALLDDAHKEGYDDEYLECFLREHHCKLDK